ncbi:XLF-domain-containing protein [Jackrogersella minutella]|nr:XLF-domain-containing protein [Jackrogersella minutella]
MASGLKWHPLPVFPDLPALMISPRFASSSYKIYVTDFSNVWVEDLDRRSILLRSLQENTSIDLSDGDRNQWTVFLSKLNDAFDCTTPDHHSTNLSICASPLDKRTEGGLALHVTCILPEPLKPLKWPIYLAKCPPVSLASELVLPLIQAHHERNMEIQDLISRLKDKDAIITKLVDKLEANHTGLEHVFNALSGKRRPSRELAEEKVRGLAGFNEEDWKSKVAANQQPSQDLPSLVHQVFTETRLRSGADAEIFPSNQLNDWWTKLSARVNTAVKPQKEIQKKIRDSPSPDAKTTGEKDDDDFQVQTLPPHLQSKYGLSKPSDDTTDGDDSPVETPNDNPPPTTKKPCPRIGVVGGRKKATLDASPSQSSHTIPAADDDDETPSESDTEPVQPRPQTRPNAHLGTIWKSKGSSPPPTKSSPPAPQLRDGDETASGSDSDAEDNDQGPSKPQSPSPRTPTPRKKVGLGRICGKSKSRETPKPFEEPSTITAEAGNPNTTSSPVKAAGRKIGTIGRKPITDGKRQLSDSPTITAAEPETEEQRTERRRAELAKELERKAAAPMKKKRKF